MIGTEHPTWLVVEQTLKVLDPDLSLTAQYKAESETRSFWWVAGMCAAMVVQPILTVILVMGAVR